MIGFGITNKGKVRRENQDCFLLRLEGEHENSVFVVCDGMGGARAGGIASEIAAQIFVDEVRRQLADEQVDTEQALRNACSVTNTAVFDRANSDKKLSGMGTTLVGGIGSGGELALANIGDSRAYHITCEDIERVTKDHSLVEELVENGDITREQAREHPRKNLITRALGVEMSVDCDTFKLQLSEGDRLLLCSDGLSNTIEDGEIFGLSISCKSPEDFCTQLITLSLERGAPDNVTALALEVKNG